MDERPKNANLALYFMETRGKALISQHFIEVTDCFTQMLYTTILIISQQPILAKTIHLSAGLYFAFIQYEEIRMKKAFLALYFLQTILIRVKYTTYFEVVLQVLDYRNP